ncbi:Calx-beta domain-containing protein [Caenimonas koreensis]|uniref:Calx-beta domain-containing protein n=1 Tax=Caenimonas koreensis DSM 17982 TaxID=1121255 RepID=A0A844B9M4_9BURK|nr:Calx-beta domain-containing protein [Caenimonas koreensis]MRD47231.1 hypothetical protein [Caenimonas koreensis DSM 17982]
MAITAAERHEIAELLVLMFNAAPGATYLSQIVSVYESVGHNLKTLAEVLGNHPGYTSTHPNFWTGDDFATNLLTPLGLTGDFQARTAIVNAFNSGVSMADITYSAYTFLNDVLANPAAYGAQYLNAAKIMNNKADVALYFSVTKGLSASALADLQAVLEGVTADPASVTAAQAAIDHVNDPQTFTITSNSPTITEGDAGSKVLTFTLTLLDQDGGATVGATTINYATTNTGATATAGDDYVPVAGTVTFQPGQTQATVSVTILGDTAFEPNETIKLLLTGAGLSTTLATGTITNDDPIPQIYLTPQADVVVGTALGETINGTQDTFTLNDNIDGKGGEDTLKLVFDSVISVNPEAIVRPFVTVTDVEHVVIFSDLSVGSDSGEVFDMSAPTTEGGFGWTGVKTIEINAAGGADVNLKSAASESITIGTADDVTILDDTVAAIEVTTARGHVSVTASDASTVHVKKAGGDVYVHTNNANIAIDNAGGSDVAIYNGNGTISALNGEDVYISACDSATMTVIATSDVTIFAGDIGTLNVTTNGGNSEGYVYVNVGDITTGTVTSNSYSDVTINADQVGTLTVTGVSDIDVNVQHVTTANVYGSDDTHVMVTNLNGWTGPWGDSPWGFDATIMISGEDDISVDGGNVEHVTVEGAVNATIDAGVIGSVTIGELSDDYTTVDITTYSDGDLSLTLAGASINELTLEGMSDVALDVTASSYAVLMGSSTVQTIDLTGAGDLQFDVRAVDGTLSEINGGTYTGNLTLDANAYNGDLTVTTGSGSDDIEVDGDTSDVIVDAGEGNNVVDVDSYGLVNVTVGDGDDDVTVNFDTLSVEGSGVALGEGTNALTLRSYTTLYDTNLDAFDVEALPLSGNLMSLTFAASIELHQDTSSTLNVGGLEGPVSYIGFGDVNVFSDSGEASLTIAGTGTTLTIQSSDDFGSDSAGGMITLEAAGVTDLTLDISDDMNVMLMGDAAVHVMANAGGSADLILDGDSDGNGTADQLQGLLTVNLNTGDNADLTLANLRSSTVVDVNAGEDATVDISYSTLGTVTVDFAGSGNHAELDINDTSDSTVTVGNVVIDDHAVTSPTDADNNNTVNIEVSDNDFSTVLVGTVTATADGDVDMSVVHNNHATVTLGALDLESRYNSVSLMISDNTDNELGPDAIVKIGDVTLTGADGAQMQVLNNVDSAVTLGNVSLDSDYASQWLQIAGNDESTIKVGTVDMTSGYGTDTVQLVISDNDGAQITLGDVTISSGTWDVVDVSIYGLSDTEVNVASLTINAYSDVTLSVSETTDSTVDLGDVKITSAIGDVSIYVSDNTGVASISFGNITIDTLSDGDVFVLSTDGMNFDADITFGDFDINADGSIDMYISGANNGSGVTSVGAVGLIATGDINLTLDSVSDGGDVTVNAGSDATVNIVSLFGGGLSALTVTAGSDATVYVSDVDSVDTVTVTAGSDAMVTLSDVVDLTSLTVTASDADITLINVNSDSAFTLDISGVHGTANVDASAADFDSTGKMVNILIGHGDVNYSNDLDTGSGTNDESRERFEFGYGTGTDVVGNVVIDNFRPGATAAVDGVWSDRIDFSHLDGVNSLEDITFAIVGNDVVIDFVDIDYGSITLTGVGAAYPNATDLVVASIVF